MKTLPTASAAPAARQPRQLSTFSKIMILSITVLLLLLALFTILDANGLHLLIPEIITVGFALVIVCLILWAGVSIYNRIRSEKIRRTYRVIGIALGFGLSMFIVVTAAQLTSYAMPHTFGTIVSPAGQKVVILRVNDVGAGAQEDYDATIARMNLRTARLNGEIPSQADPVAALESYPAEAYGHVYIAMPKKLGVFYSSHVLVDGAIYRGSSSQSGLHFEWIDDDTVRFYLTDPEPGDEGEMTLYLNP